MNRQQAEQILARYAAKREARREYNRTYRLAHPEMVKARVRRWQAKQKALLAEARALLGTVE